MAAQSTVVEQRFRPMVAVAAPVMAQIAAVVEVVAAVEAGPGLGPAPVPVPKTSLASIVGILPSQTDHLNASMSVPEHAAAMRPAAQQGAPEHPWCSHPR
jgi:hypothetical protein